MSLTMSRINGFSAGLITITSFWGSYVGDEIETAVTPGMELTVETISDIAIDSPIGLELIRAAMLFLTCSVTLLNGIPVWTLTLIETSILLTSGGLMKISAPAAATPG